MSELINVGLYGSGTRDSRLRAEYIYCDHTHECSAYQKGTCFCVTAPFSSRCGLGVVTCSDGCTKQSKKYWQVTQEAKNNPVYAKLKHPPVGTYLAKMGDKAFLNLSFIWLEAEEDGSISVRDPHLMTGHLLVDADMLTPKNLHRICTFKPRAMMGGTIHDYQFKVIPIFLHQLKELYPGKAEAFFAEYPDFVVKPPNWIGKRAKLITCKQDELYKDHEGNIFHIEGDDLVCDDYKSAFNLLDAPTARVRVKMTENMVVKITDNKQVLPTTIFV